jgi:hypothetical protein
MALRLGSRVLLTARLLCQAISPPLFSKRARAGIPCAGLRPMKGAKRHRQCARAGP